MLPADAGCIVINVSTAFAIFEAVFLGQPLYRRLLTISGDAVVNPENFYVPTGVAFGEIVEKAGGFLQTPEKLIAGGPMMGFAQSDFSQVVTKTSSALTAFRYDLVSRYKETACINCGRCVDACPARLVPSHLADMVQKKQMEKFEENYGLECVNCGSCSWSCPAGRPLAALVNQGRQTILAARRKAR
jgi:electron transport complex protein RnfC